MFVREGLLEGRKRGASRDECICVLRKRSSVGMGVYICVYLSSLLHSAIDSYLYVKTAERLQLHKTVISLLIVKYILLEIVSCSHTTTPETLSISSLPIASHKENNPHDTLATLRPRLQRRMLGINVSLQCVRNENCFK